MMYQHVLRWGIAITFVISLLSGCAGGSPTTIALPPAPTSTPLPSVPQASAILPRPSPIPTIANTGPFPAADTATPITPTTEGTVEVEPSPTLPPPIDRPFLMRIDRISVVVGRGILLTGRVANGTLQAGGTVEILSPHAVIRPDLLTILISNAARDQVTVGDYASILIGGVEATNLSPGMLLAEAGEYESYEEALTQLQ
jgi:translation elongation factor EF-Tu-like GTPase